MNRRMACCMAASLLVPPLCGASTTLVRGLVGAPDDGFQQSWHTHLGFQPVIGVRQKAPDLSMYWGTAFVPRRVETETVTFSWVGAMGGGVSSAGNFTLSVNGHPVVQFDVVSRSTHFPARYSSCDLYYDVLWTRPGGRWTENALDTSGHFFLVVDASALEPGRPVILSVTGTDIGEHRWFGIIYDATMVPAMPQRRWREFRRYPEPAQPPPATAEAGFEHYLPQYSDPGCFTPIGWPADPAETAVSPTGQLMSGLDYTRYGSGVGRSEPPYYRHSLAFAVWDGQRLVPVGAGAPARQNLYRGRYPMVYTNWTWSDFSLQGTAFSEPLAGDGYASGTERTLAWAVWDIRNYAREPREITLVAFYVGDEDAPAPEMVWRDGAVHRDGSALFSAAPSEGFSQEFHPVFPPGLVIDASRPFDALIEDRGAANALVVRGTLRPGESKHVAFNRVFDFPDAYHWKAPQLPPVPAEALTARACEAAFKRTAERWETLEKRFCFFRTPDARLNLLVRKAMLDGCFLTKKWNGRDIVFDSVNYRCQWDDSSAKWFYALDLWGDHETSERLLDTVFARQGQRKPAGARTREGCFSDVTNIERDGSAASWASGNGWALWAMAQHARLSGDRDWLARHKEAILAGCDWIIRERGFSRETPDNPCAGLLYGKFVCDLPDQGQVSGVGYFTYTDAISYLGLHQMGQLLTDWGHAEGARILTEAEAYRKDILAAVDKLTDKTRDPWFIPWMLHAPRHEDRYFYDVCGPINLAFAGVVPRTDERIAHVIRWIVEHEHGGSLEEAAAGRRHAPEGAMFYSQDLAVVLLQQGRVQDFQRIFYTLLSANVSHDTLTTCEWRRNTQPHIHSIASLMRMFRTMLVDERDGGLYLLSGVPLSWTNMGQVIEFRELPTRYGPVSLLCSSQLYMRLVVVRGGPQLAGLPLSVRIPLPEGYRISRAYSRPAQILEIEGEWVRWEGHAGDITFHIEIDRASAPR